MTYCDLCHEFTTDAADCTWCGHRLEVREPVPDVEELESTSANPRLTPLNEAIAAVRQARRAEVRAASEWALAQGLPCDRDVVALCFEVVDRFQSSDGLRLDRVDVTHVLTADAGNWSAMNGAMRPEGVAAALWIVLHHFADRRGLSPSSDPLPALLEPLQCYGGLGRDGRERPEGMDIDFPCQCFLPHDPTCSDGMAQHIVGYDRKSHEPYVVHAEIPPRSADPPVSVLDPLFRLARRVRASGGVFVPRVEEFAYVGRIPPSKLNSEMWMYRLLPIMRRGFDPLVVDEHGRAHRPRSDRRRKLGYRWVRSEDFYAMHASGVAAREIETEPPEPVWDDGPVSQGGLRAI